MIIPFPEPQFPEAHDAVRPPRSFSLKSKRNLKLEIQIDAKLHGQALQVVDTGPKRDGLLRLLQELHRGCRTPDIGHPFLEDGVTVAVGGLEGEGEIGDMKALPRPTGAS